MKIGFLGAGKMAEAIISSLISTKTLDPHQIMACEIDASRREQVKRKFGINLYSRPNAIIDNVDVLFLAVKPQNMAEAVNPIADSVTRKHLVISIAAGRTIASIEALLPEARVIRVMPNLPCVVGEGMSALCLGTKASRSDRFLARSLLGCSGRTVELEESVFDAVTALSGSGPAFFAFLLDAMAQAAATMGIERRDALLMAEQTMLGTAKLLIEKDTDPTDLIDAVSSPGGTTVAALSVLGESNVPEVLAQTLAAAAERSRELNA